MKIYGIAHCDTVKAVRKQLDGKDYTFIDFKSTPPAPADIARWYAALGDKLVNRQSKTWREHACKRWAALPSRVFTSAGR